MNPAIIVVDMLKDAVTPFSLDIVAPINRLTRFARDRSIPVVFAMDSFLSGDFVFRGKMKPHCLRGTAGAEVMDQLQQRDTDIYLPKRRFSAFYKTDLDQTLRLLQVDTVAIVGINTHWCVLNTAFDALANDFATRIITDCCASFNAETHASVLKTYTRNPLYPLFQLVTMEIFRADFENREI
jgi:nicotinamidase-related amidase